MMLKALYVEESSWSYDAPRRRAPPWHAEFCSDLAQRGPHPIRDVEILVCKVGGNRMGVA